MLNLFIYLLIISVIAAQSGNTQSIQIHLDGKHHGAEAFAKDGEEWLGLFRAEDDFELAKTTLKVTTVFDGIVDNGDEKTGKLIETYDGRIPLILIRGLDTLQEGKVKTAFLPDSIHGKFLYPGEQLYLNLAQTNVFTLSAFGRAERRQEVKFEGNYWEIRWWENQSNLYQILERFDTFDMESNPWVIWAGDLDRDDKIDMLLDIDTRFTAVRYALYLSSQAEPGSLVKKVAEFLRTAC